MKSAYKLWLFCIIFMFIMPAAVYGHAYIEQSTPAQESKLQESPKEIRVKFTEEIDTKLSKLTLETQSGQVISTKQTAQGKLWLILEAPPLETGEYQVLWQILSLDTHVTDGSFRFSIGTELSAQLPSETISLDGPIPDNNPEQQPSEQESQEKEDVQENEKEDAEVPSISSTPSNESDNSGQETAESESNSKIIGEAELPDDEGVNIDRDQEQPDSAAMDEEIIPKEIVSSHKHAYSWNTFLRIFEIVTAVIIGGMISFRYLIWYQPDPPTWLSISKERLLYGVAAFIFLITGSSHLLLLTGQLSVTSSISEPVFWETFGVLLSSSNIGAVSWLRPTVLLLLLGVTFITSLPAWGSVFTKKLLIIALMISFPFTGHAMSGSNAWGISIVSHTLHLFGAAIWIGGIVGIVYLSFRVIKNIEALKHLNTLLNRFSIISLPMVVLIVLSGVVLTCFQLSLWSDLWQSQYGQWILWKTIIFLNVLGIAVIHRYVLLPKLDALDSMDKLMQSKVISFLLWGIRIELILAVIILLLAGFLSTTPPPQN